MNKRDFYAQPHVSQTYEALRFGGPSGAWVNQRELQTVHALLPPAGRVLDLGCGTGRLALFLSDRGYQVVGLDTAAAMLTVARTRPGSERVHWVQGDALAPPFGPGTFDAVVALRLAFHFADLQPLLQAMVTVTRPGGRIVLDTYTWSPRALVAFGRATWGDRVSIHRPGQVAALARRLGLTLVDRQACFLFSPYLYRLLPLPVVHLLARLEAWVPPGWRARVFWAFAVPPEGSERWSAAFGPIG